MEEKFLTQLINQEDDLDDDTWKDNDEMTEGVEGGEDAEDEEDSEDEEDVEME